MTTALHQTAALFMDAYRELNARKLFWVVLALSGLIVLAFAAVGINERGVVLLFWEIPNPIVNLEVFRSEGLFYKSLFITMGFGIWLTWIATVLALISTASIIPEFVSGGSIETVLSKPVSRVRLFFTKYLTGLLFAALQVTVFSAAAFLVIGIRGGEWVFTIFLAIPLVVLFFSYLYVISAAVGLVTRSTIAAILAAGIFWFVIFLVGTTEGLLLQQRITYDQAVLILTSERDMQREELEKRAQSDEPSAAPPPAPEGRPNRRFLNRTPQPVTLETLATTESNLQAAEASRQRWTRFHAWAYAVKTVLPKTTETMGLLERRLISAADLDAFTQGAEQQGAFAMDARVHGVRISQRTVQRELDNELRARSIWWIIGTSLLFQGAVLALAAWVFARRDF